MTIVEQFDPTVTEQADRMFLEGVRQIPGARLELQGGRTSGNRTTRVFIASRGSEAWRRVRELEGRVIDAFPAARFDVWLSEPRPER